VGGGPEGVLTLGAPLSGTGAASTVIFARKEAARTRDEIVINIRRVEI
jgi:hypothetical protein